MSNSFKKVVASLSATGVAVVGLSFGAATAFAANDSVITDAQVKTAINQKIAKDFGVARTDDQAISQADLDQYVKGDLVLTLTSGASLAGLGGATGLTSLVVNGGDDVNLTSADLGQVVKLTNLNRAALVNVGIDNSELASQSWTGLLAKVTNLDLSQNEITDFSPLNNTNKVQILGQNEKLDLGVLNSAESTKFPVVKDYKGGLIQPTLVDAPSGVSINEVKDGTGAVTGYELAIANGVDAQDVTVQYSWTEVETGTNFTGSVTFDVDSKAPAAPTADNTVLPNANGSVWSNGASFAGTAEPGAKVTITSTKADGSTNPNGPWNATAGEDGKWSIDVTNTGMETGDTFSITATDTKGNTSQAITGKVDATAPVIDPDATSSVIEQSTDTNKVLKVAYAAADNVGTEAQSGLDKVVLTRSDGGPAVESAAATGAFTLTGADIPATGTTITLTAYDKVGNASSVITFTVDSDTTVSVTSNPSNGRSFDGTGEPGATITVKDANGQVIGTTTVGEDGKWALTPTTAPVHNTTVTIEAKDAAGNFASTTTLIDSQTTVPTITGPDAPVSYNGDSVIKAGQDITLTGTAEPGATVSVQIGTDSSSPRTVTADSTGKWTLGNVYVRGGEVVTVNATDKLGNKSATLTVVGYKFLGEVADTFNGTTLTGKANPGATVTITPAGAAAVTVTADKYGAWSYTFAEALPDKTVVNVAIASVFPADSLNKDVTVGNPTVDPTPEDTKAVITLADGVSNKVTPGSTVAGTAKNVSAVKLVASDGTEIAGTVTENGAWAVTIPEDAKDGATYTVVGTAADGGEDATVALTVTAPANPDNGTDDNGTGGSDNGNGNGGTDGNGGETGDGAVVPGTPADNGSGATVDGSATDVATTGSDADKKLAKTGFGVGLSALGASLLGAGAFMTGLGRRKRAVANGDTDK